MNKTMPRPIYIFDIDGTLALIDHRLHLLDEKQNANRWREFYKKCDMDKPNKQIIQIMDNLRLLGCEIILFSSRSANVREKTIVWLAEHTSFMTHELELPGILTMRDEGDYTPDDELKESWLNNMLKYDVLRIAAVFDDRDRVVNMWRKNGITCLQVAKGDF